MKTTIQIKNFKQLEDVTLEIKPLTLLFGPNGSGKSTFLKAIAFMSENYRHLVKYNNKELVFEFNEMNFNSYEDIVINNETERDIKFVYNVQTTMDEYFGTNNFGIFSYYFNPELEEREENPKVKEILTKNYEINNYDDTNILFLSRNNRAKVELLKSNLSIINFKIEIEFNKNNINSFKLTDKDPNSNISIDYLKGGLDKAMGMELNLSQVNVSYDNVKKSFDKRFKTNDDFIDEFLLNHPFTFPSLKGISDDMFFDNFPREVYKMLSKNHTLDFMDIKKRYFEIVAKLYNLFVMYPRLVERAMQFQHIKAIREIPKDKYLLTDNKFPKVRDYYFDEFISKDELSLTDDYYADMKGNTYYKHNYSLNFETWLNIFSVLSKLKLAKSIYIIKKDGIGSIVVENMNGSKVGLSQASSGLLQILPIFTSLMVYDNDYMSANSVLIEQPELHLHPKVQSELAQILYDSSIKGLGNLKANFIHPHIVETHSEHLVRKLQVLHAQGKVEEENYAIYYLDNKSGTTEIKKMEMEENGFFKEPWPDGFFDESYDLTEELLLATKRN